ncbi:MAG: single-stranded DNA-binding protein [Candidatus Omnitrophota bacterium]|jgi:single-strand DNA-binding protein|nr:MAG: single-stranded DNA-binding protein [Candidatus Omnitrophota bacterium]
MASFNKVFLIGNLTKDPELRYTPQGTAVANLRLAVNRRFKTKTQEFKDETCFITVVVWSKQAENCNQYLQKGSPVFIEGRLQSRSWEDNAGQKRNTVEVRAERVQFLKSATKPTPEAPGEELIADSPTETEWLEESEEKAHETES